MVISSSALIKGCVKIYNSSPPPLPVTDNTLRELYELSDKSISYEYFVAKHKAEERKKVEASIYKSTLEVIDYINTYYDIIYKDITSNAEVAKYNVMLYNKAIAHLNSLFGQYDKLLINAHLETFGIYTPQKIIRIIHVRCIIASIIGIIANGIVFALSPTYGVTLHVASLILYSFSICLIYKISESSRIKEPKYVNV